MGDWLAGDGVHFFDLIARGLFIIISSIIGCIIIIVERKLGIGIDDDKDEDDEDDDEDGSY